MAKTDEKRHAVSGSGRGNVPVTGWEVGVTLNMGDFNSLRIIQTTGNVDASSDEATKREAEQIQRSATILYEVVDMLTGAVLDSALGDAGSGAIQSNFLKAVSETMEKNSKKGLYAKKKS
ncbi:hypothetical protein LCGC14_2012880 [marine sediment metagenome]|uniref:Uncharacterized protein n=1 Tax=marine sediment metagenome TaxID=412755 RepID=A0A0F9EZX3_9ZZZZ